MLLGVDGKVRLSSLRPVRMQSLLPQYLYSHTGIPPAWSAVGEVLQVDERGRVTIPKDARKKVGIERALVLEVAEDHLELRPLADAFADLKGSLRSSLPFRELRKEGEEQLIKETVARFRGRR